MRLSLALLRDTDLMEIRYILQILKRIGLMNAATPDELKVEDRALLTWISDNISAMEIIAIETEQEPFRVYAFWVNRFRETLQKQHEQDASNVQEVMPTIQVVVKNPEVITTEIEGFTENVLYPHRAPHSHELVPRSFFGLPIFSTNTPGTSFEHIDKKSMQFIVDTLSLKLDEPELLGVTLDPAFDALLFRAILSGLRSAPQDEFEMRDEQGGIIQEGRMHAVNYRSLMDTNKYSDNTLRSPQFIEMVDRSCKRISQFRLAYKVNEEGGRVARYMPFFSHLQFNLTTQKVEFIGTSLIPQLFRDDKTLSLNTKTLNLSNGKIESSLLYYLTSLPRGFAKVTRHVPLLNPVPILALLTRCYPKESPEKLAKDYPKIERIKNAMNSLRDKTLIKFNMEGRGKNTLFKDVIHYCEMNDMEFQTLENQDDRIICRVPDNSLKHYLDSQSAPRRASDAQKLAFAEKVIPNAYLLIKSDTDEAIIESFKGVLKPKLLMIRKFSEMIGHQDMIQMVDRIMDIRQSA